jgi:thiamine biosynthesis lipoprotein
VSRPQADLREVVRQRHVTVMGGSTHVLVVAPDDWTARTCLELAAARLHELEARWSRFRPGSELSRLNANCGRPQPVSADTRLLVGACLRAYERTGGRFDPTILTALEAQGYDRSLELVPSPPDGAARPDGTSRPAAAAAPGCEGVTTDDRAGTVTLPPRLRLDPGGIGKGLAADLVTADLVAAGALGALVNVSGDVRARGIPAGGAPAWTVGVEHPLRAGEALALVRLPAGGGAVASSSVLLTRWGAGRHHLIDPTDGRPTSTDVLAATITAAEGAWADAATKLAFATPGHRAALDHYRALDVAALLVLDDGRTVVTPAWAELVRG